MYTHTCVSLAGGDCRDGRTGCRGTWRKEGRKEQNGKKETEGGKKGRNGRYGMNRRNGRRNKVRNGRSNVRKDGRKDGRMEGKERKERKEEAYSCFNLATSWVSSKREKVSRRSRGCENDDDVVWFPPLKTKTANNKTDSKKVKKLHRPFFIDCSTKWGQKNMKKTNRHFFQIRFHVT